MLASQIQGRHLGGAQGEITAWVVSGRVWLLWDSPTVTHAVVRAEQVGSEGQRQAEWKAVKWERQASSCGGRAALARWFWKVAFPQELLWIKKMSLEA